ncbi:MAG: efflux RND transporter permease subunit, partial [Gemmatimonadota bacterium]
MKILEFPVRNHQFTVLFFLMLVALGLSSWRTIPRAEDPPLDFPSFTVIAVYPGAGPRDLERLVVREVEERLDGLDRVESIESSIEDGVAVVFIQFEANEDPDEKYDEVLREMNALRPELPPELVSFTVEDQTTLNVAIAQLALVSETAPYSQLDEIAEDLEDRIAAVPGVREAERWGIPERRVDVELDLGRLAELRLPPTHVLQAIASESSDVPAGRVDAGSRSFNVRASGSYESLDEVANTVVRANDGQLVRIRDLADVRW